MGRKLLLLTSFFITTPILLGFSILFFFFVSYQQSHGYLFSTKNSPQFVSYAAIPTAENLLSESIEQGDSRKETIQQFLAHYISPLEPFAADIIKSADTYGIDYRLIPSIAMQESNLCKKIVEDSYNCWGFGIYGTKVTRFQSYPEAIDTVTKTLAKEYKNKGLTTPDQIMKKYTPSSNGSWANGVNHFMNQL